MGSSALREKKGTFKDMNKHKNKYYKFLDLSSEE